LEQEEGRKLSRSFSNLEQARRDAPGYYRTSDTNEDEAAQHKSFIMERVTTLKDKLFRKRKKLKKASEKVAHINPFIAELMDWFKIKEQNLQRLIPKQLTLTAFTEVLEQCKVSSML